MSEIEDRPVWEITIGIAVVVVITGILYRVGNWNPMGLEQPSTTHPVGAEYIITGLATIILGGMMVMLVLGGVVFGIIFFRAIGASVRRRTHSFLGDRE